MMDWPSFWWGVLSVVAVWVAVGMGLLLFQWMPELINEIRYRRAVRRLD